MVVEIANKSSSGSTCVLVRGWAEILFLAATGGVARALSSSPLLVFQVLLFSFCLLLVPAMYSSDTRGSVPAEYVGKRLRPPLRHGLW